MKTLIKVYLQDRKLTNLNRDKELVINFLNEFSYLAIRPYCKAFYKSKQSNLKEFKREVDFCDISNLYKFDKYFSSILLHYLIMMERKLKSKLINLLFNNNSDGLCKFNESLFVINKDYPRFFDIIKEHSYFLENKFRKQAKFEISTYKIPSLHLEKFYKIIDKFSLGDTCKMMHNLTGYHKNIIRNNLNIKNKKLVDILSPLAKIRNIIAHDEPLYIKDNFQYAWKSNKTIIPLLELLTELLNNDHNNLFKKHLKILFKKYENSLIKFDKSLYQQCIDLWK